MSKETKEVVKGMILEQTTNRARFTRNYIPIRYGQRNITITFYGYVERGSYRDFIKQGTCKIKGKVVTVEYHSKNDWFIV